MIEIWVEPVGPLDPADLTILDARERRRLDRLARPEDRAAFAAGHVLVRRALAAQLGVGPSEVAFGHRCGACGSTAHGKPYLTAAPGLAFNPSRSRGLVAVAVGGSAPLGLDLEAVDDVSPADAEIVNLPERAGADAVARQWVRTEAVLKAAGTGLGVAPEDVRLSSPESAPRLLGWPLPDADRVHLTDLAVPAGFAGALAVIGGDEPTIHLHQPKEAKR